MMRLRFTTLWFLFGPVLGCMWLAAVNYENNLVYAVLYLVAALTFVSVFHTWRNLASLEVEHVGIKPAFAGEEIEVEIHLRNRGMRTAENLVLQRQEGRRRSPLRADRGIRIEAGDARIVTAFLTPAARGRHVFDRLLVRSSYPFGLFWAGLWVQVGATHFVYPAPGGSGMLPALQAAGTEGAPRGAGDDFSGVRAYSPGESLRHVDWKAYARGRPLVVKQFSGGRGVELWLDAHTLRILPLEERLSQLTRWAVEADEGNVPYGLRLGRVHLAPAVGPEHRRQVLEALANHGQAASGQE